MKRERIKDAEEIAYDRRKEKLTNRVQSERAHLQVTEHRLATMAKAEADYRKGKSLAVNALDDSRQALGRYALAATRAAHGSLAGLPPADDGAARAAQKEAASAGRAAVAAYGRAVRLLRDKRETLLLVQALGDLGDAHLCLGAPKDAGKAWSDGVDALFASLDACAHWRHLYLSLIHI